MIKTALRSSTVLTVGVIFASAIAPAFAQTQTFDLPAGDAMETIPAFAEQSGLNIIAPADRLEGKSTPAISGEFDTRAALLRLIESTDLRVATHEGQVITLEYDAAEPATRSPTAYAVVDAAPQVNDTVSTTASPAPPPPAVAERVVVVGSQIAGAEITGAVPVTVLGSEAIADLGLSSGEDLYRSLPIAGDVSFNTQHLSGGSQGSARGDVSSINLRGLGSNYTLLLLNGRRTVPYPITQGRQESSYNANAIPTFGLERLEILRDGAAALYGADAVAGVVNNVLQKDFVGFRVQGQIGVAEGTSRKQLQTNLLYGTDFADYRGNFTVFANLSMDTKLYAEDQPYTAATDLRPLVEGTSYAGNTAFDGRGSNSPWGGFQAVGVGAVSSNGTPLTNGSGQFHIQPNTNAGCIYDLGEGLCIDDGVVTGGADRNLRFDQARAVPGMTVTPGIKRANIFSTLTYDITDGLEFFGEAGLYLSETESKSLPVGPLSHTPVTVPASNYYNPFGPVGSANRIDGLNIPAEGLPLKISNYLLADVGGRPIKVDGKQHRLLLGLRGEKFGWDWESAALYSDATAEDISTNVQASLWQQALARSTPDAYNPFNGGDPANPELADATPSADLSSFLIDARRYGRASLGLVDFKASRNDLLMLPAGPLGIAVGAEVRWETSEDDRDQTGDFSTPFIDFVTGQEYASDTVGASAAWDVKGNRTVHAAYAELAVPLVSPEMGIPLAQSIDLQLAGRYESYSDVGSVAKPKVAGSWDLSDSVRVRGSWQQGFIAPGIQQLAPVTRPVNGTRVDEIRCEADLRAGRIASWSECSQRFPVTTVTAGNPDLKPEESESTSYGVVLTPAFLPPEFGDLTVTADHWEIQQEGKIGAPSNFNAITLDYLLRTQGSSNPNVIRAAPTQAAINLFQGTGIAPAGEIVQVNTNYDNFELRDISGFDVGVTYNTPLTAIGEFTLTLNYSQLLEYFQTPSAAQQTLIDAQANGLISSDINVGGAADLLQDEGNPETKWNAGIVWRNDNLAAGFNASYTGEVYEYSVVDAAGQPWEIADRLSLGLWGEYTLKEADATFRFGVRNLTDETPPLSSSGYAGNLYQPYGRYWYGRVTKTF